MTDEKVRVGIYAGGQLGDGHDFQVLGTHFMHTETGERYVLYKALQPPYMRLVMRYDRFVEALERKQVVTAQGPRVTEYQIGLFKHFKGKEYEVICHPNDVETGESYIAYQALYAPYTSCIRLTDMFYERVDRPEIPYRGRRFWHIGML